MPAGWYPDPFRHAALRYWDGAQWTGHVAMSPPGWPVQPAPGWPTQSGSPTQSGWPTQAPPTDGVSVAALITGVLLLAPVAFVLSLVGFSRTKDGRRGGRPFAIAGLVLSIVSALLISGVGIAVALAPSHPSTAIRSTVIGQDQLRVGICLEVPDPLPATPDAFDERDCSHRRNGEVFVHEDYPATGAYPGLAAMKADVSKACFERLHDFLGDDGDTTLHVVYLYPTEESWQLNSLYTCIVVDRDHDITGSLKGMGATGSSL